MRVIKNECLGGGGTVSVSPAERDRGEVRCAHCGRILKLRKGVGGLVLDRSEHLLPRHHR